MRVKKVVACICILFLQIVNSVDMDYYFTSALRSQKLECLDENVQMLCQAQCGLKTALCVNKQCHCISFTSTQLNRGVGINLNSEMTPHNMSCSSYIQQLSCQTKCGIKPALCINKDCYCVSFNHQNDEKVAEEVSPDEILRDYAVDYNEDSDSEDIERDASPEIISIYSLRPTLRHHIAHFCPNLDVARECIRKCIALGKPAFCGKDHVCYCGHKYEHSQDNPGDAKKIYAEFKDMYDKYFGKGTVKDMVELE